LEPAYETNQLDVAGSELGLELSESAELGGADGCEVVLFHPRSALFLSIIWTILARGGLKDWRY
jgi:hypothetical protein